MVRGGGVARVRVFVEVAGSDWVFGFFCWGGVRVVGLGLFTGVVCGVGFVLGVEVGGWCHVAGHLAVIPRVGYYSFHECRKCGCGVIVVWDFMNRTRSDIYKVRVGF